MKFEIQLLASYTAAIMPLLFLLGTGLALMLLDAFGAKRLLTRVAALGLAGSAALGFVKSGEPDHALLDFFSYLPHPHFVFGGTIDAGGPAAVVHAALCMAGLFTLFFLGEYLERLGRPLHDLYSMLVFSVLGMSMMANSNDLVISFIGLETMSICLYVFAASFKTDTGSNESGLKYFLLGSFASAFLLMGIALMYGLSGSTNFSDFAIRREAFLGQPAVFFVAVGMILVGFLFKVSAFPFHLWTPDVYQGAPTPLTGFMATASKLASFVALAHFLLPLNLTPSANKMTAVLLLFAALTMIFGNIVAARQTNLKRLLAYSGIAHSGYVLLGMVAGDVGIAAVVFYMITYTFMTIGAFGVLGLLESGGTAVEMSDLQGLSRRSPWVAAAMSLFLLSMAGLPPLAGFMGKYQLFSATLRADLLLPTVLAVLTSVVGAYYYLRVIWEMYFVEAITPRAAVPMRPAPAAGLALLAALVLAVGLYPGALATALEVLTQATTYALIR